MDRAEKFYSMSEEYQFIFTQALYCYTHEHLLTIPFNKMTFYQICQDEKKDNPSQFSAVEKMSPEERLALIKSHLEKTKKVIEKLESKYFSEQK